MKAKFIHIHADSKTRYERFMPDLSFLSLLKRRCSITPNPKDPEPLNARRSPRDLQEERWSRFATILMIMVFVLITTNFIIGLATRPSARITLPPVLLTGDERARILPGLQEGRSLFDGAATVAQLEAGNYEFQKARQSIMLHVKVEPGGYIYLDGMYIGRIGCTIWFLTPGIHELIVADDDWYVYRFKFPLLSGSRAYFHFCFGDDYAELKYHCH